MIVPTLAVPIQPILEEGPDSPYSMFSDYWKYFWVFDVYRYDGLKGLLSSLGEKVIAPAEAKIREVEQKRKAIEPPLIKP
jgi:hypothetical protein